MRRTEIAQCAVPNRTAPVTVEHERKVTPNTSRLHENRDQSMIDNGHRVAVFRFASLHPVEDIPDYHPRSYQITAIQQLWEAGWSMRDVARLANVTLVDVARAIGNRTRQPHPAEDDDQDGELDPMKAL